MFSRDEFVALLSPAYADLRQQLKADIGAVGGANENELACVTYSTLAELVDKAADALPDLLRIYLWTDLLDVSFDANAFDHCQYVLDEITAVKLGASVVTIDATAYRIRPFEQRS